jgi:hypothetical protein
MVLCAFFCFMLPTFAHAGLIEWIDQWSGPGDFWGTALDWRLVCVSEKDTSKRADRIDQAQPTGEPEFRSIPFGIIGPSCVFKPVPKGYRRIASLNLTFGFYNAEKNDLPYSDPGVDKDVKLASLEPSFWMRVGPGVEVGTGFGIFWVGGPAFESFDRVYLKPIQVDFKPLVTLVTLLDDLPKYGSPLELISFRAGLLVMPGGLAAKDFGALPGFKVEREFLSTFSVMLDLEPLMRKFFVK